ncbi:MAG: cardiolipin synthase [Isosphaeraceae bacterium]
MQTRGRDSMHYPLENSSVAALVVLVGDALIRVVFSVRVIMRRRPVAVSLAWLTIILSFPFAGAVIYSLFGELRLGKRRAAYAALLHGPYERDLAELRDRARVDWSSIWPGGEPLARLALAAGGSPALSGNGWRLLDDAATVFHSLIADIDAAQHSCHLEFYIWYAGGHSDDVVEALLRARTRGVSCRVLVDAVGSHSFLRGDQPSRLRTAGVEVQTAMPVGLLRMWFVRFDLRLHRKIAIIDDSVAYTGSMNLVDPCSFPLVGNVGPSVDAMARLTGPSVAALAITFREDWELETGSFLSHADKADQHQSLPSCGSAVIQVVPSGPIAREESIKAVLLMAIYAARRDLVLTTPYFVPDESLVMALMSAAFRGVEVSLVVPAQLDSRLARLASQPHKGDLLESGVRIFEYEKGLLHTKSVTVDGELSLFGSLNLDPRSFLLNFEITLAVYDRNFTASLRTLQQSYIDRSIPLDPIAWNDRSPTSRLMENTARLLSPLL